MAYLSDDELLDTEGGFTVWDDKIGAGSVEETLEQALAEERLAELESELEQDEHPVDYDAELETEEEEAAPVSEKRLKREIRAEAVRRLDEQPRIPAAEECRRKAAKNMTEIDLSTLTPEIAAYIRALEKKNSTLEAILTTTTTAVTSTGCSSRLPCRLMSVP